VLVILWRGGLKQVVRGEFGHGTGFTRWDFFARRAPPRPPHRRIGGPGEREDPEPDARVHFTKRQAEILALAASGLSDKETAARLGLTVSTIRSHMQRLYKSYGIHTRTGAVGMWLRSRKVGYSQEDRQDDNTDGGD
jgi:DNA-binding CsgD family transcriptional regulator